MHLLWLVPAALVVGVFAFGLGLFGWCGDGALGCRFGAQQALASAIPPLLVGIIIGALLGAMVAAIPWSPNALLRRRVGISVGICYLVIIVVYVVGTLLTNSWP